MPSPIIALASSVGSNCDMIGCNPSKYDLSRIREGIASIRLNGICDLEFIGDGSSIVTVKVSKIRPKKEIGEFTVKVSDFHDLERYALSVFLNLRDKFGLLKKDPIYAKFMMTPDGGLRFVRICDDSDIQDVKNGYHDTGTWLILKDWDIVNNDTFHPVVKSVDGVVEEGKTMLGKISINEGCKKRVPLKNRLASKKEVCKKSRNENNIDKPDYGCINDSSDGVNLYLVGLWPGGGYFLATMLVWANNEGEALDIAANWCADPAHHALGLVVPEDTITEARDEIMADMIRENPSYYHMSDNEIEDLNDTELCQLLFKKDAPLFDETLLEVDEEPEFYENFRYHDGDVYTWAQEGMIEKVDPEKYADICDIEDDIYESRCCESVDSDLEELYRHIVNDQRSLDELETLLLKKGNPVGRKRIQNYLNDYAQSIGIRNLSMKSVIKMISWLSGESH